jgi:hypothetical protein
MATRLDPEPVWYDHGAWLRPIPAGAVRLSALDDGTTHVEAFLLDAAPVTVRRYARFLAVVGQHVPAPLDWAAQLRTPDAPVTGVGPDDAAAFAASVGGRLPTVWEWQRAARGRFGLAAAPLGEPFGVTGLCTRWEWTQTGAPMGFWVCGGRYRDRADDVPDVDHLAFETRGAADVGFRVARDLDPAMAVARVPAPAPAPLAEPTQVVSWSQSTTEPEGLAPPPPPPAPPPRVQAPSPPLSIDENLAALWAVPPRAGFRCADIVILDAVQHGAPDLEREHRAVWLRPDGERWPVALTAMWSMPASALRIEARLMWHALREHRPAPTPACAFHVVDGREGVMPVFVERVVAGVPLRTFLDALAARRDTSGVIPLEVAVSFALHVIERGVMPAPVLDHDNHWSHGQVAWDGTWHPCFDVAGPGNRLRIGGRAAAAIPDMAPEAIAGRPLDERALVYRAGILLYRLLAGARPWVVPPEPTMMDLLRTAYQGERISIRTVRPDLSETVAAVVDDSVAIDRDRRPGDLATLLSHWRRWLEPGFWQDAADVIAPKDTAGFIAALAAELFPRTREAQLQWWDEAEMVDIDVPVPSPSVTPLPMPPPSVARWVEILGELAAHANNIVT